MIWLSAAWDSAVLFAADRAARSDRRGHDLGRHGRLSGDRRDAPLLSFLKTEMYWRFTSFDFSVIPLFLMMGNFATRAGVTAALFRAASALIGHFRGGLAMAAIGGCAAFGTISGSSLATAAMMGQVSLPELRRYKYSASFATGALGCRRHARRAHSAIDPVDHLRDHGGRKHRPPVPGRLRSGHPRRHRLYDRHRDRGAPRPEGRPGRGTLQPPRNDGRAARHLDGCARLLGGHGRHLFRHLHPDRGRRRRRHSACS